MAAYPCKVSLLARRPLLRSILCNKRLRNFYVFTLFYVESLLMKKLLTAISLIANVLAVAYIFTMTNKQAGTAENNSLNKNLDAFAGKKIAIISPAVHPSLAKIEQGIVTSIGKELPGAKTLVMNANGQKNLMLAQVQEVLKEKPDAVVTIGAQVSQLTREFIKKRHQKTPQIFTAVSSPELLGLTYDVQELTGLEEKPDYALTSEIVHHLAPELKTVLLVYNPSEGNNLDRDRQDLEAAFASLGIKMVLLEVFQTSEIASKAKNFIRQSDAVIVLKDNTVVCGIDALIKLCQQYHKPLIAHDLDSGDKGAALSFGVFEETYGLEAGIIAANIIKNPTAPLPSISKISKNHIKINTTETAKQGLFLTETTVKLLQAVVMI